MIRRAAPFVIFFGLSLVSIYQRFNIAGVGVTLAVPDLVVAILLVVAALKYASLPRNPIVPAALVFGAALFASGLVNFVVDPTFVLSDFVADYVRIVGLMGMVLLLPSLQRGVGHHRLASAAIWMVRLHALLLLADSVAPSPVTWGETGVEWAVGEADFRRPRGLFGEPSRFSVATTLALLYVLQVERNGGRRQLRIGDLVLVGAAVVTAATLSGLLGLFLIFAVVATSRGAFSKARVAAALVVLTIVVGAAVSLSETIGPGSTWRYLQARLVLTGLDQGQIQDESARQRLFGSLAMTSAVIADSPFFGGGLGSTNAQRLIDRYAVLDARRSVGVAMHLMPTQVLAAAGLFALLPAIFMVGYLLASPETRLIGVSLVAVATFGGGAFEPLLWWHTCLAIALKKRLIGGAMLAPMAVVGSAGPGTTRLANVQRGGV